MQSERFGTLQTKCEVKRRGGGGGGWNEVGIVKGDNLRPPDKTQTQGLL